MTRAANLAEAAGSGFAFRNRVINGSFLVWQRGTSFVSTSVNEYSADRFRTEGFGTSTTISQGTFAAGQTDVPGSPQYYCRVQVTGTPGGSYWAFQQRVEAPQNVGYGTATYTLSFYARAVSGTIAANTFTFGLDGSRTGNPALTTSWQKLTTTIPGYAPSGSYGAANIVHITNAVSSLAVDIANVQLEPGTVATPFEFRPYGTELALCQRYYQTSYSASGYCPATGSGTTVQLAAQLFVQMRATPSAGAIGGLIVTDGAANYTQSSAGVTTQYLTPTGGIVQPSNFTGLTSARPHVLNVNGGYLTFSAEL